MRVSVSTKELLQTRIIEHTHRRWERGGEWPEVESGRVEGANGAEVEEKGRYEDQMTVVDFPHR